MKRMRFAAVVAAMLLASMAHAGQSRPIGLTFSGDREGFFLDPVMTRVYISAVVPDSLAGRAGFAPNDEVLEIEGTHVPGMHARALMGFWNTVSSRSVIHFVVSRAGSRVLIDLDTRPAAP